MNNMMVCNYSVIRFLPYQETEEFVNVGVVIMCPKTGYFDYLMETIKRDRVIRFFPELEPQIFIEGRKNFKNQLIRIKSILGNKCGNQNGQVVFSEQNKVSLFKDFIRIRESVFRFGNPGTVLTENPVKELERLFDNHVRRQFARSVDYQEEIMRKHLENSFKSHEIECYIREYLGNENYRVNFPFVRKNGDSVETVRAIKTLHLAKDDPTRILEHGDQWVSRIRRLKGIGYKTDRFMFAAKMPHEKKSCIDAADDVRKQFEDINVVFCLFGESEKILSFARAS